MRILAHTLTDQVRPALGWLLALLAYALLIVVPYPSTKGADLDRVMQDFRFFMGGAETLATLEGYLTSQIFYLPLALGTYATLLATKLLTGEVASGHMHLLLAHPVSRTRILSQKYGAIALLIGALAAAFGLFIWVAGLAIEDELPLREALAAGLNLIPVSLFYGSLAFAAACILPGRVLPTLLGIGAAGGTWVVDGLAHTTRLFADFKEWTVFHWYMTGRPFSTGLVPQDMAILVILDLMLFGVALFAFIRKDISRAAP